MLEKETMSIGLKPKTGYRWVILFVLWLLYLINYLDRTSVLTLLPVIRTDLHITHEQAGLIASIFFVGYAIAQVLAGMLADRIGAKRVMSIAIIIFTFVTFATGLVRSFSTFVLLRLGLGIGEGCHFAPASRTIADWFPNNEKGRATSLFTTTFQVGPAVIPILATSLATFFGSWRPVFFVLGIPGLIGIFMLWYYVTNTPEEELRNKGRISKEEYDYILSNLNTTKSETKKMATTKALKVLFTDISFIAYCLILFFNLAVIWGELVWISSFLYEQHGFSLKAMGFMASVPSLIAIVALVLGGWLMDKVFHGKAKWILAIGFLPCVPIFFLLSSVPKGHIFLLTVALLLMGFFSNIQGGALYTYPQMRFPKQMVGTAIGISNGFGQLGSFLAPFAAGFLVKTSASGAVSYNNVFIMFAGMALIAGVLSLFLSEKPKVVESLE
ncbi:MFS transporter [Desulfitobacterium sp. Sab5]|uniref:MFS transporter n=1 Tax=Desulfitobacterium nosdiversum TaxID=3375356 RepID=UPI003CFA8DBB